MTLHLARRAYLLVECDDDKYGSQTSSRNHLELRRHPFVGLMVETSPLLLEEHRCAPFLVLGDPEFKRMSGKKPDLPANLTNLRKGARILLLHWRENLLGIESPSTVF